MVLKGIPAEFSSFVVVTTQNDAQQADFTKFKTSLRNFEDTANTRFGSDVTIMKSRFGGRNNDSGKRSFDGDGGKKIICYSCGNAGHKSTSCNNKLNNKLWCSFCKSSSHNDSSCRSKAREYVKQAEHSSTCDENNEYHSFTFFTLKTETDTVDFCKSLLVDCGATAHIVTDDSDFVKIEEDFKPEFHFIELADGTKSNNIALKRGNVEVNLRDDGGNIVRTTLENALYIPSYPQDIFSVTAATDKGSSLIFKNNSAELISPDGVRFEAKRKGGLYYLYQVDSVKSTDPVEYNSNSSEIRSSSSNERTLNTNEWHRILGHCNVADLLKLESVVIVICDL